MRGAERYALYLPELKQTGIGSVCRREENIGIQKQAVQLPGAMMWNRVGVQAELSHFFSGALIVSCARGGGQKKLRFPLGSVPLDGNDNRWANQDTVFASLGGYECSLFNAVAFP